MVITAKKHSNVYYIYNLDKQFEAVEKATGCKNNHGLDLFKYKGYVYEGRTGCKFITKEELYNLDFKIKSMGGIEKLNEKLEEALKITGESPRYTRPDERRQDIFPPDPAKENIVLAKDSLGKKHYYYRFYNENGIELYTLNNKKESNRTVFVECEGFMLGVDQHHRFEQVLKWLAGLENGVKGVVEKIFNESMADPRKWADPGYANILGRVDEANAHNAPIREARRFENEQRNAEREAKRIAKEQAIKTEYEQAIKTAENNILNKQTVLNSDIQGKSLIMQLFREHEISVPLKTQGWIINALHDIHYDERRNDWNYKYYTKSKDSTVFCGYLSLLVSAVQTKQQFEEINRSGDNLSYDNYTENDNEDEFEI